MANYSPQIPDVIIRVSLAIRKVTPRPGDLPVNVCTYLRFQRDEDGRIVNYCPLGLCPGSGKACPDENALPPLDVSSADMMRFAGWWDSISPDEESAQGAVNIVWGPA